MRTLPDDITRVLVPSSARSMYDTAIRLSPFADPAAVVAHLALQLSTVATAIDGHFVLYLEPTGDACNTGNWVDIFFDHGTLWADMTPRPAQFGGSIPPQIDHEQELAGWVLIEEHEDHEMHVNTAEACESIDEPCLDGPFRRLVAGTSAAEVREWADLVTHSVSRVIGSQAQRWYLHAKVEVLDHGPFHDPPFARSPHAGEWSVNVGALLDPQLWERAVWRPDSEGGAIACDLELHHYHEPPCPPPPRWSARYRHDGDKDGDKDANS